MAAAASSLSIAPITYAHPSESRLDTILSDIKKHNAQSVYAQTRIASLVSLFDDLNSVSPTIVQEANRILDELFRYGYTFHDLALKSFPLWPVDAKAIQKIAIDGASSPNSRFRERAHMACSYLVTCSHQEGFDTAKQLASQKLRSDDAATQQEGLVYFTMLLKWFQPQLVREDLLLALVVAKKIHTTKDWLIATTFYEDLIKHGRAEDVVLLKEAIPDAFIKNLSLSSQLCDSMITHHHNKDEIVLIPLEAARVGAGSESAHIKGQAFGLFWRLLSGAPKLTIEPLMQSIEKESTNPNPPISMICRLNELAGHDFSNLFMAKETILSRFKEDAPRLLKVLENLSSCKSSYTQGQVQKFKETLEAKLKKEAETESKQPEKS